MGINLIPVTGSSFYLAKYSDRLAAYYQSMLQEIGGPIRMWQDILWKWQAMFDSQTALDSFLNAGVYSVEEGTT